MKDEVVLYTFPMSRGRVAHWMLEELGIAYRLEIVRIDQNQQMTPAYRAVNFVGKIPALVHRGAVVTETAAICAYLADAFPSAKLAPAIGDPQRAPYLRWMFYAASCYEAAIFDKIAPRTNPPPRDALGYGSYQEVLDACERALQPGPYLLGEHFSAADIYMAAQISFSILMKRVEPTPRFTEYVTRLESRPAHQRMAAQCNALLEKMGLPPISYPE